MILPETPTPARSGVSAAGARPSNHLKVLFSQAAGTYRLLNRGLTFGLDSSWRNKAARIAASRGPGLWLDVCTGTGDMAHTLAKAAPSGTRIIATDFSPHMMARAIRDNSTGAVSFSLADSRVLPFKDNIFSLITLSFAARNLHFSAGTILPFLREFHRVLAGGGTFLCIETTRPTNKMLKLLLDAYARFYVMPLGTAISGSSHAYRYLSSTIRRFCTADEFSSIIRAAGFVDVAYEKLFAGIAAIHTGQKAKQ